MGKLPMSREHDGTFCQFHRAQAIASPSENVRAERQQAARFADRTTCLDAVLSGASNVLVNSLPAARLSDQTAHGARLLAGAANVFVSSEIVVGKQLINDDGELSNNFVAYDPKHGRLFVVSYLQYSGPDTSAAYAEAARKDIETMWSGRHNVRGKPTDIVVKANVVSGGAPQPGYDQISVDKKLDRANQTLGGGSGEQHPTDDIATPDLHVPAHEYGHTLGIRDQYMDVPGKGSVPDPTKTTNTKDNIMVQTWKDRATGNQPHPYPEHYEEMLDRAGL